MSRAACRFRVLFSISYAHGPYRASHGRCVRHDRDGRGDQCDRGGPGGRGGLDLRRGPLCGGVHGGGGGGGASLDGCTWQPRRSQSSQTRRGGPHALPNVLT